MFKYVQFFLLIMCCANSFATTLYQWRIWCNTENAYVTTWLADDENGPTTCPHNTNDSVSLNSISIIDVLDSNEVSLKDEWVPTGGYFKTETLVLDVDAGPNVITSKIMSWPFDITLMTMQFNIDDTFEGDVITVECPFDTIIGALVQDVAPGDTVLHVDESSIAYSAKGFYITLDDGVNLQELGRIIAIDKVNKTLTIEQAAVYSYQAMSPTYVKITLRPVDNFTFGKTGFYRVGASVSKGSPVPANRLVRIKYINKSASAKKLIIPFEYLY